MTADQTQNTGSFSGTQQDIVFQNLELRVGRASHTKGIFDIMTLI
jgi:hypothetical protein